MDIGEDYYSKSLHVQSARKSHSGQYNCISPAGTSSIVVLHVHTGMINIRTVQLYFSSDTSSIVVLHVHTGMINIRTVQFYFSSRHIQHSCTARTHRYNKHWGRYNCISPAGTSSIVVLHVHTGMISIQDSTIVFLQQAHPASLYCTYTQVW